MTQKKIKIRQETPRTVSNSSRRSAKYRNPKGAGKYFGPYRIRRIIDEIEVDQVEFDPNIIKDTLCPEIWDEDGKIKPEVRKKLLQATKLHYDYLKIEPVKLLDIVITGSIANYNYHDQSDIDVHLILNYEDVDENDELVSEYFGAKKALWQLKHDIKIKGHDVEFYVQDKDQEHHSSGIYSLVTNDWVIKPEPKKSLQIDVEQVKKKAADFINRIETVSGLAKTLDKVEKINDLKLKIRTLRQAGLNSAAEEFSVENLVFKILRNSGYLQMLSDAKREVIDQTVSLDEYGLPGDLDPTVANAATNRIHAPKWREMPYESEDKSSKKKDKNTLMIQSGIKGMNDEKIDIIKDFISFARCKLKLEKPVKVGLRKGRDEYIHTTASYLPYENENYVRCEGRALVDILRSIAHELTHNRQRELGIFNPGDKVQNIDTAPGGIETQANAFAGALIKDFADNYGYNHIHDMY